MVPAAVVRRKSMCLPSFRDSQLSSLKLREKCVAECRDEELESGVGFHLQKGRSTHAPPFPQVPGTHQSGYSKFLSGRRVVRQGTGLPQKFCRSILAGVCLLLASLPAWTQQAPAAAGQPETESSSSAVRELQEQVRELRTLVGEIRSEAEQSRAETADLRRELQATREQLAAAGFGKQPGTALAEAPAIAGEKPAPKTMAERLSDLEDSTGLLTAKVDEQHQTKIESGSKYRMRLSGIVLLNLFSNHGALDNEDFPEYADIQNPYNSRTSFGATMRQSEIGLEVFGPHLAGARTSASLQADFAGDMPYISNGVNSGMFRLRMASARLDWQHTSIVAGQDGVFFSSLSPTSFASVAVPALSYAGNLWGWTPQVRVEHRIDLENGRQVTVQGGILDNLTGEPPYNGSLRNQVAGDRSGIPAYAGRVAWTQTVLGRPLTVGAAGYYSRQNWGFNRDLNGWAGMADWDIPLSERLELSGEFYRGVAIGGLGGGLGRSVLFSGNPLDPASVVRGLNSVGGWSQLKLKLTPKLEANGAFGLDSPMASDLRAFAAAQSYIDPTLAQNRSAFVNFVYRPRSNLLFSSEYRYLQTFQIDQGSQTSGQVNLMMGVLF